MITGEIAILFASAAGIGAAAATWVYDRRLAKRLTDLQRDARRLESLADAYGERLTQTSIAIDKLRRPVTIESPSVHIPAVSEDVHKQLLEAIRTHRAELFPGRDAHTPVTEAFRAAMIKAVDTDAKHPLYAKTGLPNQPVASLRPDTPTPCTKCGKLRVWKTGKLYGKDATLAHCETCQVSETPKGVLVYYGYPTKPNWDCPNCSYRSYQPRADNPRCPICKGLDVIE